MIAPVFTSCEHTLNTLRYADRVKELGVSETNGAIEETELEVYDPDDPLNSPSPSRTGTVNSNKNSGGGTGGGGGANNNSSSNKNHNRNASMGLLKNNEIEADYMRTREVSSFPCYRSTEKTIFELASLHSELMFLTSLLLCFSRENIFRFVSCQFTVYRTAEKFVSKRGLSIRTLLVSII